MSDTRRPGAGESAGAAYREAYAWTGNVLAALRSALDQLQFIEMLPVILSERYEPGARHSIAVLGDRALPDVNVSSDSGRKRVAVSGESLYYLPVSHCVEKYWRWSMPPASTAWPLACGC